VSRRANIDRGTEAALPVPAPIPRLALRIGEVAESLGISERKVRDLLPQLPHVRVDRAVLIPVEALRHWLADEARAGRVRSDRVTEEILASMRKG